MKLKRNKADIAAVLQYTVLFIILVMAVYCIFIINHKSFVKAGDGVKQGYFWTVEMKHQMEMLFKGNGLQQWSWSKLLGMSVQTSRYWDPFNWFAAAFPAGYIELGYTIATLMRLYCGGLACLALMRYTGLSVFASVFGAAAYSFSGYSILTGVTHAEFLVNLYLFPLLVLAVEMMYRGKSPAFFSIATALYLVTNFYNAYMAAISIVPFILLRYFAYKEFTPIDYAKNTGRFAAYGILGICVGGIQFVPDFFALSGASTESITDKYRLFFDKNYYIRIGDKLLGTADVNTPGVIGWTLIVIVLLAIAVSGLKLKDTPVLMTLILFAATMIPLICSIYNGFSYPIHRWIYALELFAVWAAAIEIDENRIFSKTAMITAAVALGITAFLTLGMNYLCDLDQSRSTQVFMGIQLLGGLAFVILLMHIRKEGKLRRFSKLMIIVILTATLGTSWTVTFINNKAKFYRNNKVNKILEESPQRAGALIEDDGFYRVDQVDSMLYRNRVKLPPNETMWWQTRSIYGYNSRVPSKLLDYNRLLCNNYSCSKRVAIISNNNRTGMDYLCGVKYFLGDDLKNGNDGSDEYAGYGFGEYKNLDGVNVLKSKFDVSLGYVFDKYISQSELEKLGYAEREQALLQAVVLPDGADLASVKKAELKDIKTAVKDVNYVVTDNNGATISDNKIEVDKSGGSVTLEPEDVENSQIMVSITGLLRNVSEGQSEPFEMRIKNEYKELIANNDRSNQTIPNIRDYTLNLGYYEHYADGKIKIEFSASGTYRFDELKIYAMDADLFDDCIGELSDRKYQINTFSDSKIEGSVYSDNNGILFLSVIEPKLWECYIDGEKAEIIEDTNIAFAGVEVPKGKHSVTFKFRNRMAERGRLLSVIGIIVLIISCLLSHKYPLPHLRNKDRNRNC